MEYQDIWQELQQAAFEHFNLSISRAQLHQFQTLYALLTEANKVQNLTRIVDLKDVCTSHFLDSLSLALVLPDVSERFRFIDIGSGAGFPALPIAILYPSASVIAVESVQKKARFIQQVAESLGLLNVHIIAERSEVLAHQKKERASYDVAVARAVASLAVLAEYCLPFVRLHGHFIAMKTTKASVEEVEAGKKAIRTMGGSLKEIRAVSESVLPNRQLIVIRKEADTPSQYPRKAGTASKSPL
jgi:16S rRNA (guanine527-N7)-methyltransferase